MDRSTLLISLLVLIKVTSIQASSVSLYQPALIGFRCEGPHEFTSKGISIIEANTPIKLTLFGESFTTDTIVAFTNEFTATDNTLNQAIETIAIDNQTPASGASALALITNSSQQLDQQISTTTPSSNSSFNNVISTTTTSTNTETQTTQQPPPATTTLASVTIPTTTTENPQTFMNNVIQKKFESRRRIVSKSYDCTDNNRVTSYKLTSDNIISPNVAVLTISLPELDPSSAVTSGLNLGLMSLDMNELAVISSCGDQRERSYARTIAPLRKRGNYLLCSLLLGNVMVNSTLTVILEEMTSGVVAVIGSTLAIVVLGEIVPQAFCARQGLAIGAKTIYLTYAFMILTFPLSYPISCLLDCVLGEEKGNVYDRERLMEFIRITGHHTQLEADEVAIISGALKLKKIKVDQIMTRIEDVFMLPIDCMLDRGTIKRIIEKGYSRIPVYEFGDRKQIVALILAKDLALLDPDDQMPVASMLMYCKHPLIFIEDSATLDVALNEFKTGKSHMAVVRQIYDDGEVDKYYEAIGVVTLEDVIEEVLQTEINDETDTLSDNRRKRRRTDAQVTHLLDELTGHSISTAAHLETMTTGSVTGSRGASTGGYLELPVSKQVQTSLSSHLTSISVGGVTKSLVHNDASGPIDEQKPSRADNPMHSTPVDQVQTSDKRPVNSQYGDHNYEQEHGHGHEHQHHHQQQQPHEQETGEDEANVSMLSRAAQFLNNIMH